MKDILLWKYFTTPGQNLSADDLQTLLDELSRQEKQMRLPFLGVLDSVLNHPLPGIRAAGIRTLSGFKGLPALRRIVSALDDQDKTVQDAAVQTLSISVLNDPTRFAHALFHPDPHVRSWALKNMPSRDVMWLALFLLQDDRTCQEAQACLQKATVPSEFSPELLELAGQGLLSPDFVRNFMEEESSWTLLEICVSDWRAAQASARELLKAAEKESFPSEIDKISPPAPMLNKLFNLFWFEPCPEEYRGIFNRHRFFTRLARHVAQEFRQYIIDVIGASLVHAGAVHGSWPNAAAQVCALSYPQFLDFPWIPLHVRRSAVSIYYHFANALVLNYDKDLVQKMAGFEICRRPSGKLDLRVLGGILRLLKKSPLKTVQEWINLEEIVASALEDIEEAIPFLSLEDRSRNGQSFLIDRVITSAEIAKSTITAMMICASDTRDLANPDFFPNLNSPAARELASEILKLIHKPGFRMSPRKRILITDRLASAMNTKDSKVFIGSLLDLEDAHENFFAREMFEGLAVKMDAGELADMVLTLPLSSQQKMLQLIQHCDGFPSGMEMKLADSLSSHSDPYIVEWVKEKRLIFPEKDHAEHSEQDPKYHFSGKAVPLTDKQAHDIVSCDESELAKAVEPCLLKSKKKNLTNALFKRCHPSKNFLKVACALMLSWDPLEEVDRELVRFGSDSEQFADKVDDFICSKHLHTAMPVQGHACLNRFEYHLFAFRDTVLDNKAGLAGLLEASLAWKSWILRNIIWSAAARLMGVWRWREPRKFPERCSTELIDVLCRALRTQNGEKAGEILIKIQDSGAAPVLLNEQRPKVRSNIGEMNEKVQKILKPWIDSTGVAAAAGPKPEPKPGIKHDFDQAAISGMKDISSLAEICRDYNPDLAEAAALRLIEIEGKGLETLSAVICQQQAPVCIARLCETIPLWPNGDIFQEFKKLVSEGSLSPEGQFLASINMILDKNWEFRSTALAAPYRDVEENWFSGMHWNILLKSGFSEDEIAYALALSPQPGAYIPAMEIILTHPAPSEEMENTAQLFLEEGSNRLHDLRMETALWLFKRGNHTGLPLLIKDIALDNKHIDAKKYPDFITALSREEIDHTVRASLTAQAGEKIVSSAVLSDKVQKKFGDSFVQSMARVLLFDTSTQKIRDKAIGALKQSSIRQNKLRRLAETIAWGVNIGRDLTGRTFKIEMHSGESLGFTFLHTNTVYINPMPILRDEPHAGEITEGLILHELGHHLYHGGKVGSIVSRQASEEGIAALLNLVMDEHLERRMQSYNEDFGHRFKKLATYAFLHSKSERDVQSLLNVLRLRALPALLSSSMKVARTHGCILVQGTAITNELERLGSSFPRFVRALRMGLGDRHNDPKVARALKLFKGEFKNRDCGGLLEIARQLREIFGDETVLMYLLSLQGLLQSGQDECTVLGQGISDSEVQAEVEKILNSGSASEGGNYETTPARFINLGPEEHFDVIHSVVQLQYKPDAHMSYARRIRGDVRRMREYFSRLGLRQESQRMRIKGRHMDKTRVLAMVSRNDPRMLVARQFVRHTDLFLGLLVDCSGSMKHSDRIEQAKLFAVLLSEAARGMPGIDVRIFGFTDSTILDAGNAEKCSAHAFEARGGNNDAAGLWHAAMEARNSRRKAKLLVMISDGSPTECTVHALKTLVSRLQNRMGIACAQVAVRPLDEICFPYYVEIESSEQSRAVQEFGRIIQKLVGKTIQGSS